MISKGTGIICAQFFRRLTHVRRFQSAVRDVRRAQVMKLLRIVSANADTEFGRKHSFHRIRTIRDFQNAVPASQYEYFWPYIESATRGQRNQLTSEEPLMFATTSGTTAQPKLIPITPTHLRDYTHAFQVHNYQMIHDFPEGARGRFFVIASNDQEGRTPSGVPYGAVSGLLQARQPPIVRRHFALPPEVSRIKHVDTKYYMMLRCALAQDVRAILGCNPSSLLLLAEQLSERAEGLIRDLYDGTINPALAPPEEDLGAFRPFTRADKHRARYLSKLLSRKGTLLPSDVWPDLKVIACWKGGPMSFYLDRLPQLFGRVPIRDLGYMASEGRGSIPLTDEGAGGVLAVSTHFFEFVEEGAIDRALPTFLTADQLEEKKRYYIFFTTAAGLYRYHINDLVEVSGYYADAPVIEFVRKGAGISSITGEKLTEEQVRVALAQAVRQVKLTQLSHFTTVVQLDQPPHYTCFVELSEPISESVKHEFLRIFDQSLQAQNPEYRDKRLTRRLGAPQFAVLPAGSYTRLRQLRVSQGAPEAQVKIPLLSSSLDMAGQFSALCNIG